MWSALLASALVAGPAVPTQAPVAAAAATVTVGTGSTSRAASPAGALPSPFSALEPGLELAFIPGPPGAGGDGLIAVVRIDPARFDLRLLNASAPEEGHPRTVRDWAFRAGASAAINASLYQADWRTATGLMRSRQHVNHGWVSKDRAVLVFDPLASGLPPVRIVDRDCEDLEAAARPYAAAVQSIRMVSCEGKGVWAPSERRFSSAAIGVDGSGRVLFIHAASPWQVNALITALLAAPIDLKQAMYVEGGPEAQLYVRGGGTEVVRFGASEHGLDLGAVGLPVPNVVAAVRKPPPSPPAPAPAAPRPAPKK